MTNPKSDYVDQEAEHAAVEQPVLLESVPKETVSDTIEISISREQVAKDIAQNLVGIFRWAILGSLGAGFLVVALLKDSPEAAAKLLKDSLIPLIQAVASFASTVFGPLLAFILGYYFGEKAKHQD